MRYTCVQVAKFTAASMAFFALSSMLSGCGSFWVDPGGAGSPPPSSFSVYTADAIYAHGVGTPNGQPISRNPRPYQFVAGHYVQDQSGYTPTGGSSKWFGYTSDTTGGTPLGDNTGSGAKLTYSGFDINTDWDIVWDWSPGCITSMVSEPTYVPFSLTPNIYTKLIPNQGTMNVDCPGYASDHFDALSPQFAIKGSTPSTMTAIASSTVDTTYGMPQLSVYDRTGNLVSTMTATAVAPDGVTVTFPFPTASVGGTALSADLYSAAIASVNSDSSLSNVGSGHYFSIATMLTGYTGAFGVAAATSDTEKETSIQKGLPPHTYFVTTTSDTQSSYAVVTLPTLNMVKVGGTNVSVGTDPTAVVSYGTNYKSTTSGAGNIHTYTTVSGTGYALVANTGSASVSVVDLINQNVSHTISVGNSPVALLVNTNGSVGYVANWADGTVSEISLSSFTQIASQSVGTYPSALDFDASGNVVVGGAGYISTLDPSTLAVISTTSQPGNVTSLAFSQGLNTVVSTMVANTSGTPYGSISYSTATSNSQNQSFTSMSTTSTSSVAASAYFSSPLVTQNTSPGQMANASIVSPNYGNDLSVTLQPNGFVVTDIYGGTSLMTGTLTGTPRGIALDPDFGYAYITVPESDALIRIPLPNEPQ